MAGKTATFFYPTEHALSLLRFSYYYSFTFLSCSINDGDGVPTVILLHFAPNES